MTVDLTHVDPATGLLSAPPMVLPRYSTPPREGAGSRAVPVIRFAENYLHVLGGPLAGQPLELAHWQKWLLGELLETRDDGGLRYRRGLVGVGRQNGKSLVGMALGLHYLIHGPLGTEVYSAAGDRAQARIVFGAARRQVEWSRELSAHIKVYRDVLECPANGAVYRALSSDAKLQQGLSPQLVIFDEVHTQPNEDLWDALSLGTGAREDPLILGITTAGEDPDSLAGRLYAYGKKVASGEVDDPSFGFWWWEPEHEDGDLQDVRGWWQANPSLAEGLTFLEDLETSVRQQLPAAFRRYRLNQWRRLGGTGWMDMEAWDVQELVHYGRQATWKPKKGSDIVVGFDGSVDRDATALVAAQLGAGPNGDPVVWPVKVWEPPEGDDTWQVPRDEVHAAVADLFDDYNVIAMGVDPAWWRTELQTWQHRYGESRVYEWPVTNARMAPAASATYARIKDGTLWHDGDPTLRRHVANAVAKDLGSKGVTLQKDKRGSARKIDAAVAFVIVVDMAERYAQPKRPGRLTVL